jgi:hypothetical protein
MTQDYRPPSPAATAEGAVALTTTLERERAAAQRIAQLEARAAELRERLDAGAVANEWLSDRVRYLIERRRAARRLAQRRLDAYRKEQRWADGLLRRANEAEQRAHVAGRRVVELEQLLARPRLQLVGCPDDGKGGAA